MYFVGILTQRWQILKKPIIGNPNNISNIVSATTVLHNYLLINNDRTYLPQGAADTIFGGGVAARGNWRMQDADLPRAAATGARNYPASASAARQAFVEYFTNEGEVAWQFDYVNRRPQRL